MGGRPQGAAGAGGLIAAGESAVNFGVSDLIEARGRFENFYDAVVVSWQFGTQGRGTYKNGVEQSKAFVEFVFAFIRVAGKIM